MKKLSLLFASLIVLTISLVSWKNSTAAAEGAVRIDDFGCGLMDGDGNSVYTDNSQAIITPSGNGMIRCQATVANSTGRAVVYKNLPCGTFSGVDPNGHLVVSASGQATLTCHVNAQ